MYCVANSHGHNYYFFNEKLFLFNICFITFLPLIIFFNTADHLIISQAWRNNCLAINDLYPLCLDQQREIHNKLVHGGIRTLFPTGYWVLRKNRCINVQPKVSSWYFKAFLVYIGQNFLYFAQRVSSLILWNQECKLVQNNGHICGSHRWLSTYSIPDALLKCFSSITFNSFWGIFYYSQLTNEKTEI